MKKVKVIYKVIGFLAFIVLIALLLCIPQVSDQVAKATGWASSKIRSVAATVVGAAVGLMFISFGITALAALPVVGIALIVIGIALLAYSLWPLFKSDAATIPIGATGLNKVA